MSKPKSPFYNLEFDSEATFWTEGDATSRRTFLMPVTIPSEFLALGVLGTSKEACFVARGTVREHLGSFIARMERDGSSVEFYARPPLPEWLLKEYTEGPPWEGHEFEPPPPPPYLGLVSQGVDRYEHFRDADLWTAGDALSRRAILLPVHDPAEFVAFGVVEPSEEVLFAFSGTVREQLGEFISQMVKEGARVELHARSPLPEQLLHQYLSNPHARNRKR